MPDTRRSLSALQTLFADNTSGDISAQDGRDELISSHPEKVCQSDTQANEPSSGQLTGDLFLPNNGFQVERYSGSAWQPWGPLFPFTKPVDGDFSWVNQGGATITTTNGGIYLNAPAGSGKNFRMRVKSAPSTPYVITCAVLWNHRPSTQYHACGLVFRESSSGKLHALNIFDNSPSAVDIRFGSYKYSDPSTFSASYLELVSPGIPPFVRMADDGTNRSFSISFDGVNFSQVDSRTRTDFLTPNQVGFFANSENATYPDGITLLSWKES